MISVKPFCDVIVPHNKIKNPLQLILPISNSTCQRNEVFLDSVVAMDTEPTCDCSVKWLLQ